MPLIILYQCASLRFGLHRLKKTTIIYYVYYPDFNHIYFKVQHFSNIGVYLGCALQRNWIG